MPEVRQIAEEIVAREGGFVNDPAHRLRDNERVSILRVKLRVAVRQHNLGGYLATFEPPDGLHKTASHCLCV